jgi:hypothetical protein
MSVYQSITEKIEINNCNERTSEIIKFVKEQILHFINLDSVKYAGIDELKLSLDGSNYCVANLRADREHDHKIDIPEDLMQMIERLPKSRKMSLWWSYNLSWYASGDKDEVVEYGPEAMFSFIREEDAVNICYVAMEIAGGDWSAQLYVCELKDKLIRFGHQEPLGDYSIVDDLQTWYTEDTAIQIEMEYKNRDTESSVSLEPICRSLSDRLGNGTDEVNVDENGFYFALNDTIINSKDDLDFYIASLKQLYALTNGEVYSAPYFYHVSEDAIAVMHIFFNEDGELQINAARA